MLCALAYLGSAAHFALVQHTTCLEHGEVVHAGEVAGHARLGPVRESFSDSRVAAAAQEATVSHGSEAHCAHAFFRRELLPPPGQGPLLTEAPVCSGPVSVRKQVQAEPVDRLRVAPKSSPPLS
ncbi:hypothetical protein STIAU_7223 [Stigmatella aurantiaca DW4/3-1]|uniref:Uncharacterized protein n=1 Tax=Stigmatella aurantiaca (strain DW4/3-1) TaxID=378806 RepID=Q08QE1_STIAD|nr:hypothetical protein STIAU_7223 [Stigmatella aurantiaca DW4/3-1]